MTPGTEAVFHAAMSLPAEDRAVLAEKLLESLEGGDRFEIDAAWAEEAERRIRAYEQGKIKAVRRDF
jgi:putative addiction module component (TIGR02574 family)